MPSRASRDDDHGSPSSTDLLEAELRAYALARDVALPDLREAGAQGDWLEPHWDALRLAGSAHPGLAFAASAETTALGGVLAPILANSPDIASVLDSLERFHPLIGRNELVVRRRPAGSGPATVSVSLRALDGAAAHPDTVDACFAMLCRTVRRLAGEGAGPDRVLLRRPGPARPEPYHHALGPVAFGQPSDACVFGPAALGARVRQADPVVLAMLAPYAQRQLALNRTPWSAAVRASLHEGVGSAHPPRLAEVARTMAVGRRTLQLRLQEEGCSFSTLVEAVQRDRALALLAEPEPTGLPVTAIAPRVGFATPAAFTRAVRRWTGLTPSAYRRAANEDH
ncbi:AraC-like DNA-binding protein [Kitasatospora gansuensis]|uniref:AraC-like DNA-binding protein n=1 Tax=Kitasatospora gansuensis TaxID=258050 RepID=A0A7W7SDL8_9ACTN|nr:AraC family transcriptional regulator [Kitasatospora gansuensis]MBB4947963.1 AraC-like DNA-binding protein [Kitasatospora gansuensis]